MIRDFTCLRCGCLCDDLVLTVSEDRIVGVENACPLGRQWLLDQGPSPGVACRINGQGASVEQGLERAAAILGGARRPLVYGLTQTTCEAQRLAVDLAERIGAVVDLAATSADRSALLAFQAVGTVGATLGEFRHRADLAVVWGCDPLSTHPRLLSRYALAPAGRFVGGRADRTLIVVDQQESATAREADLYLPLSPNGDAQALAGLRAMLHGISEPTEATGALPGAATLLARMRSARYGVLIYDATLAERCGQAACELLLHLVQELNAHTRWVALLLRGGGNPLGAENVLTWRTGFPLGVDLAGSSPRYDPRHGSADAILARRAIDAALVIAPGEPAGLSPAASEHLASLPRVVLNASHSAWSAEAAVAFTCAVPGVHLRGTVYRMDEIALPLRAATATPLPSETDLLAGLLQRLGPKV